MFEYLKHLFKFIFSAAYRLELKNKQHEREHEERAERLRILKKEMDRNYGSARPSYQRIITNLEQQKPKKKPEAKSYYNSDDDYDRRRRSDDTFGDILTGIAIGSAIDSIFDSSSSDSGSSWDGGGGDFSGGGSSGDW